MTRIRRVMAGFSIGAVVLLSVGLIPNLAMSTPCVDDGEHTYRGSRSLYSQPFDSNGSSHSIRISLSEGVISIDLGGSGFPGWTSSTNSQQSSGSPPFHTYTFQKDGGDLMIGFAFESPSTFNVQITFTPVPVPVTVADLPSIRDGAASAVPEPTAALLFGVGIVAVGYAGRRRHGIAL